MIKKISKPISIVLAIIAFCCLVASLVLFHYSNKQKVVTVEAATSYSATDFKMLDKGSVRKEPDRNAIRFATFIGNASEQANATYWDGYEMGTLFIPASAMDDEQELTVDGVYSGISPVVALFDGNIEQLANLGYGDGKFFISILELSSFSDENILNGYVVARTYVKNKATNEVTYLDQVSRAPAFVASKALDNGEDDTNNTLSVYVSKVAIGEVNNRNARAGVNLILKTPVNVDGLEPTYSTTKGTINGNKLTPDANGGLTTITASLAGGKYTKSFEVYVQKNENLERQYYAEKDANEMKSGSTTIHRNAQTEYMSFTAFNVDKITYNGELLLEGYDYLMDEDTNSIKIEKATLVAGVRTSNTLTFESAKSGNVSFFIKTVLGTDISNKLDYNSGKRFDLYSYYSVRDSEVTVDHDGNLGGTLDTYDSGIDFYDSKYISEYYDAGMEYLLG